MQGNTDMALCRVALSETDRTRLDRELDMFIAFETNEAEALGAIEDRELVLDAWALLDAIGGKDAPVSRVRRMVIRVADWTTAQMRGMTLPDAERERSTLALLAAVLEKLPKPQHRTQALRQLRASVVEGC